MNKRHKNVSPEPFYFNDSISVFYELEFNKDVIRPGDIIRFKGIRGTFLFTKWVHNSEKDVTWIDCLDRTTFQHRSFYIQHLKGIVKPKRSRRKKVV